MGLRRDLEKNYCNYGKDKCMNRNLTEKGIKKIRDKRFQASNKR